MTITLPLHALISDIQQGDFTVGKCYPLLRVTDNGNGGMRGFYLDNNGMPRMVPVAAFNSTECEGSYQLPTHPLLTTPERIVLATRWNIHEQTVHDWMRPGSKNPQLMRVHDALRGAQLPLCDDQLTRYELKVLLDRHGFYIQELAARWDSQEFGQKIHRDIVQRPALFWDMWRGMINNERS